MLAIKLKMIGRRNQRSFRVIVQEARSKLGGKFIEDVGWYNPHANQLKLNRERISYWMEHGAQPTETVQRLLKKSKTSEVETYSATKKRPRKLVMAGKGKAGGEKTAEETGQKEGSATEAPAENDSETQQREATQQGTPSEIPQKEDKKEVPTEEAKPEKPAQPEESKEELKEPEAPIEKEATDSTGSPQEDPIENNSEDK